MSDLTVIRELPDIRKQLTRIADELELQTRLMECRLDIEVHKNPSTISIRETYIGCKKLQKKIRDFEEA